MDYRSFINFIIVLALVLWPALLQNRSPFVLPASLAKDISVPENFGTIAEALQAAVEGDIVYVDPGLYMEAPLQIPPGVSLIGSGWESTTIQGDGTGTVVTASDGAVLEGFTITGSGPDYFDSGVWVDQGQVSIRGNRIMGNTAGFWAWCFEPDTCNIEVHLEGNLVVENFGSGINSNEFPVIFLQSNTVSKNGENGAVINNPLSLVQNNIFSENIEAGLVNEAAAQAQTNAFWSNGIDNVGSFEPGFFLDPLLIDPSQGDYSLRAGSPVIGAGTPAGKDIGALPFEPSGEITPFEVSLESVDDNAWQLSWTPTGAAGYTIYHGHCSRQVTTIIDAGNNSQHRIEGVSPDRVSFAAVSAYDEAGLESLVQLAAGVRAPCPTAPQDLEVGAFPENKILLRWVDTSPIETGFVIERGSGAMAASGFEAIARAPADTRHYEDNPPLLGETYWYRVLAGNANGNSEYSNESFSATFDMTPNQDEQYLLVLLNEARADPGAFGYPDLEPVPPLAYNELLNYSARSHSQSILNSAFQIGHCDGIGRCPTERARAVGYIGGVGENLVQGQTGPEWVEFSNQAFMDSAGHRENRLSPDFNEAGLGHTYDPDRGDEHWKGQYTENFSYRSEAIIPHLPSGIMIPYRGSAGTSFTFIVNYYHPDGYPPHEAWVYVNDQPFEMELSSGSAANGTYRFTGRLTGGAHPYYFFFSFPGGAARLPLIGAFPEPFIDFGLYFPILLEAAR
jgi:uncharacterized protein YkwD